MADGTEAPDERLGEVAHRMFELVTAGATDRPEAYVEAGVLMDLTSSIAGETASTFGRPDLFESTS